MNIFKPPSGLGCCPLYGGGAVVLVVCILLQFLYLFIKPWVGLQSVVVAFPGLEVIKLFPCSTQPSTKFILLINVKMPTIVGILTFISNTTYDT